MAKKYLKGSSADPNSPTYDPNRVSLAEREFGGLTSNDLKQGKSFELPDTKPLTDTAGALGAIQAQTEAFTSNLERERDITQKREEDSFEALLRSALGSEGEVVRTAREYSREGGVDDLQTELDDINQQILAEQRALENSLRKLQDAGGGLTSGMEVEARRLEGESLRRQADLSIIQLARQGKYDSAKAIADRAVAAQLEGKRIENEALKFSYERNKDLFTRAEQRAFESAQADRNRELDMEEFKLKAEWEQKIRQNDPLYRANLQKTYAEIDELNRKSSPAAAVTPPIVNPETGRPDPTGNFATFVNSVGAKDNVNLQNIGGVLAAVQAFAERNKDGQFPGLGVVTAPTPAFSSDRGRSNKADIDAINLKVQQWASGAALTEEQTKQVKRFTPKQGDTYAQTRSKANDLTNFMLNQARGVLAPQGYNYNPAEVNFFADGSTALGADDLSEIEQTFSEFNPEDYFNE